MKFIINLFILLISTSVFCQNQFNYFGTLILSNNKVISYKLELKEKNGIVNGFSITNIGTEDETKSDIKGVYSKSDKSFQLQEHRILATKSKAPLNTFCYIKMNLTFKGKLGSQRLEGNFTGTFLDSNECAKGKILLIKEKKIKKKIQKFEKKLKKEFKKIQKDTMLTLNEKTLSNGEYLTINWLSKKIIISIWDANKEDGDRIQLKINNEIILHNFKTKNKQKKIKYTLNNGENIIKIKALNLGKVPPNTSRIELVDDKNKYTIITQLELGNSAVIKIIK